MSIKTDADIIRELREMLSEARAGCAAFLEKEIKECNLTVRSILAERNVPREVADKVAVCLETRKTLIPTDASAALEEAKRKARLAGVEDAIEEMNRYWESTDPDERHRWTVEEAMLSVAELRAEKGAK